MSASYRDKAARHFPPLCVGCRKWMPREELTVHHRDGDRRNNAISNLEYRCHPCHDEVHGRRPRKRKYLVGMRPSGARNFAVVEFAPTQTEIINALRRDVEPGPRREVSFPLPEVSRPPVLVSKRQLRHRPKRKKPQPPAKPLKKPKLGRITKKTPPGEVERRRKLREEREAKKRAKREAQRVAGVEKRLPARLRRQEQNVAWYAIDRERSHRL